jgi:hypothetical protein
LPVSDFGAAWKRVSEETRSVADTKNLPPTADRTPKSAVRLHPGIHQDLSSGSPENSDVLIGNPIRK